MPRVLVADSAPGMAVPEQSLLAKKRRSRGAVSLYEYSVWKAVKPVATEMQPPRRYSTGARGVGPGFDPCSPLYTQQLGLAALPLHGSVMLTLPYTLPLSSGPVVGMSYVSVTTSGMDPMPPSLRGTGGDGGGDGGSGEGGRGDGLGGGAGEGGTGGELIGGVSGEGGDEGGGRGEGGGGDGGSGEGGLGEGGGGEGGNGEGGGGEGGRKGGGGAAGAIGGTSRSMLSASS